MASAALASLQQRMHSVRSDALREFKLVQRTCIKLEQQGAIYKFARGNFCYANATPTACRHVMAADPVQQFQRKLLQSSKRGPRP